jgi:hypothetical protein
MTRTTQIFDNRILFHKAGKRQFLGHKSAFQSFDDKVFRIHPNIGRINLQITE